MEAFESCEDRSPRVFYNTSGVRNWTSRSNNVCVFYYQTERRWFKRSENCAFAILHKNLKLAVVIY